MVTNDTKPVDEEPNTFTKACDHPNANSWAKWWEVICKEFTNMNKQQVQHMSSKSLLSPNCRCVKNKCVKIKCNGVYRACLIACRYSQIPVIDFSENFSLAVNDVNFCVILLVVLHFGIQLEQST